MNRSAVIKDYGWGKVSTKEFLCGDETGPYPDYGGGN